MRTRFANIILLIILFFHCGALQASLPSDENVNNFIEHNTLSCLDCHFRIKKDPDHPSFEDSSTSCLECHDNFSEFPHNRQYEVECMSCHTRHSEKITHDAHLGISCKVCHLHNIKVKREIKNNKPLLIYEQGINGDYDPHRLTVGKDNICSRCHYSGNNLGVSDYALPAKSIICMPCHTATLSIDDIPSAIAITIFLIGIVSIFMVWLSAGMSHGRKNERKYSVNRAIRILIFDIFFQRRILKVSVRRWIIHEMIFLSIITRFLWGIVTLFLSLVYPDWNITWLLLDKNNLITGLIFDITGLLILMGGCLIVIGKKRDKKLQNVKDLPKSNILVNTLLGGMIITGFIVEGARIAMTGSPEGSQFAFIGYLISRALLNYHLNGIYAYLWYLHAVLTAAFIAYLPFSRMFHVFTAPLSLFLRGESKD